MRDANRPALRIARFSLISNNAPRLAEFYQAAFDARQISTGYVSGAQVERETGSEEGGALRHVLRLGAETLHILQFDTLGRPYPSPLSPYEPSFQHFALAVSDLHLAMTRLSKLSGWKAISTDGPQRLPKQSGDVTAFKFQDPDGHPLEFLEFPAETVPPHWQELSSGGVFLGIDHSAISVRDTAISMAFYRTLGFEVTAQTFNEGPEQAKLDGVPSPQVEVTALSLATANPHLELLCYRSAVSASQQLLSSTDVAATRTVLSVGSSQSGIDAPARPIVDPDGHHLLLIP